MQRALVSVSTLVIACLLTGCVLLPQPERREPETAATESLQPYYDQQLQWQRCESSGFECTTATVPIDYDDPDLGDTELALVRLATDSADRRGSLLLNPGGPGGSGFDFVAQAAESVTSDALRASYDIVGWDPRGVGRSAPVDCYGPEQLDEYLYGVPDNAVGSDAWLAERAEDATALAAACDQKTGQLLGHIDARTTARDMDLMRSLLGDEQLNYLGFSYGTVFGAQYAELFPDRVGRVVLDGATDPTLPQSAVFTTQMAGFEGAYRAFLEYCLETDGCPFEGDTDDAAAQSSALFAAVDARALTADDARQLTSATLGTALAYPLYDEASWDALAEMLSDLRDGDPELAFEFADAYNGRLPDGSYEGNSTEVYTAALCVDGVYSDDLAGTRATLTAIEQAAPIIGRYLAYTDWVLIDTACQAWPADPVLSPGPVAAEGAAPILVLGTTNDPATPYAWGQALAEQLDSGVFVTRNGEGHTAYGQGNACIDDTVDAYFTEGTVPAGDPSC